MWEVLKKKYKYIHTHTYLYLYADYNKFMYTLVRLCCDVNAGAIFQAIHFQILFQHDSGNNDILDLNMI